MNKYKVKCKGQDVDVYDVLKAFDVRCPAMQHAIKKMLKAGQRGDKDAEQDLTEAIISLERAKELLSSNNQGNNVIQNIKTTLKIKKGYFVTCVRVHKQSEKSLTEGKKYKVIDVDYHNLGLDFYILDDKGRKKKYNDLNRQFDCYIN